MWRVRPASPESGPHARTHLWRAFSSSNYVRLPASRGGIAARRVRWSLRPPPSGRVDARTPGSGRGAPPFSRRFGAISASREERRCNEERPRQDARPVYTRASRTPGCVVRVWAAPWGGGRLSEGVGARASRHPDSPGISRIKILIAVSWKPRRVRRAGRSEPSTSRMISYFSAAVCLTYRPPSRRPSRFFEQPILEHELGDHLFELHHVLPQLRHFGRRRLTRVVSPSSRFFPASRNSLLHR